MGEQAKEEGGDMTYTGDSEKFILFAVVIIVIRLWRIVVE